MKPDILPLLEDTGALLEGHFLLTSGRHSNRYIEKFRLLEQPRALDAVASAMVKGIDQEQVDVVLGAAVGGILLAGAVSRILDRRTMFTERVEGAMALRRGFQLSPGDRVLIVEDIVTTGGSVLELVNLVRQAGAEIHRVVCLVDRSEEDILQNLGAGIRAQALLQIPIPSWEPKDCPHCQAGVPVEKPGRTGKK